MEWGSFSVKLGPFLQLLSCCILNWLKLLISPPKASRLKSASISQPWPDIPDFIFAHGGLCAKRGALPGLLARAKKKKKKSHLLYVPSTLLCRRGIPYLSLHSAATVITHHCGSVCTFPLPSRITVCLAPRYQRPADSLGLGRGVQSSLSLLMSSPLLQAAPCCKLAERGRGSASAGS